MRRRRRGGGPRGRSRAAVLQLRRCSTGEHLRDGGRRGPRLPRLRDPRLRGASEVTVDPVQRDDGEFLANEDSEPGADIIALPQLERLPPDPDFADAAAGAASFTSDNRSARLEALELVRAAVELADRIEKDAQE